MKLLRYERRGTAVYMDGERVGTCLTPEIADQIVNAVNAECVRIESGSGLAEKPLIEYQQGYLKGVSDGQRAKRTLLASQSKSDS